ncbi:hypothetical protein K0M31_001888 [Melipona bicolor]|uniref:Uncharacterized protein n=1 Tax=Melipona bicolor TaxID=60889 RepID=A0AA40KYB3_9HYME|nr:hypothetical protein K0M31_001888 [Melipona bicolor]
MVSARMSRPARENPWMIQPWRRTKIEKRKGKMKRSESMDIANRKNIQKRENGGDGGG